MLGSGRLGDVQHGRAEPRDHARIQKVLLHQRLDPRLHLHSRVAELGNQLLLHGVSQAVVGALVLQMDQNAEALQETVGRVDFGVAEGQERRSAQKPLEPAGRQMITQPSGSLLEVRLELIDRVVELLMTPSGSRHNPFDEALAMGIDECGEDLFEHLPAQFLTSGHVASVEQGQNEFEVVQGQSVQLLQVPDLMAQSEACVPEIVQERCHELFGPRPVIETVNDQQIHVGLRKLLASSIAGRRQHADVVVSQVGLEESPDQCVDQGRVLLEITVHVALAQVLLFEEGSVRFIAQPELAHRGKH